MKKILPVIIVGFSLFSSSGAIATTDETTELRDAVIHEETIIQPQIQSPFATDPETINEYTWSFMRYDHAVQSENFDIIDMPKPTQGIILIPTDMMSIEVCRAAVSVYSEDKMEMLNALEAYDVKNMIHSTPAFFRRYEEWNSPTIDSYRKVSAHEMRTLGQISLKGNLVGDCYSQSSFNTAVLRLCGFSPEEVFNLHIPGHIVNIVNVDGQWVVLDSTYAQAVKWGQRDTLIFDTYDPPFEKNIIFFENDKYFICFGVLWPEYWPYLDNLFSNIDPGILIDIVEQIVPLFNHSALGREEWEINEFIENATPCPDMITIEVPYTVEDAAGSTPEEKAQSLAALNKAFIFDQIGGEIINQYDRSLYSYGFLSVDYPQAYANAAKLAAWTSWFAIRIDGKTPFRDCLITTLWIRLNIINRPMMYHDCVAFSDFPYLRRAGSSLDQALMAYGTLRNMKKDIELWQPEELFVVVTDDNKGYLAVNLLGRWNYLNFEQGRLIVSEISDISFVFNEQNRLDSLP